MNHFISKMAIVINRFCCWSLETATTIAAWYALVATLFAFLLTILDLSASFSSFEISGSFHTSWRVLVWKEWLACDIVMLFAHILMLCTAVYLILAVRLVIYKQLTPLRTFFWIVTLYTVTETAVGVYEFSWYGKNNCRLPYNCFVIWYWLLRMISNMLCMLTIYSRVVDIKWALSEPDEKTDFAHTQGIYPSQQVLLTGDDTFV